MLSHQRIRRNRRLGANVVEFAVVCLPFLLFVFAVFEYGRFTMMRHLVANSAREGARLAVVNTDIGDSTTNNSTTGAVEQHVRNALVGQDLSNVTIRIFRADRYGNQIDLDWETKATYQHNIAVTITATYKPMLGKLFFTSDVTLTGKAVMKSEGR